MNVNLNRSMFSLLILLLLLSACSSVKTESMDLIEKGNAAYEAGDFPQAKALYKQALDQQIISSGLYYNFANTLYRQSHYAEAVLYFKKALDLSPRDAESKANLQLAREKLQNVDSVTGSQELSSVLVAPRMYLSEFECQILFLISYLLCWVVFLYQSFPQRKLIGWSCLFIAVVLLPSSFFAVPFPKESYAFSVTSKETLGVTLKKEVNVYAGNSKTFQVIHILSEGLEVVVTEKRGDWLQVIVGDSKGWVVSSDLGLVRSI